MKPIPVWMEDQGTEEYMELTSASAWFSEDF